jgi:hypothetical protein
LAPAAHSFCSLQELSLADNPLLQIGREAAQLLVVSLPCLQHVHVSWRWRLGHMRRCLLEDLAAEG